MQKFWRILKKVLVIAGVLSGATLFVVVLTSAIQKQNALLCKGTQIKIDYESGMAFLSETEINEQLNSLCGGKAIGKTLSGLDFHAIEKELEKNPFVENAEVYTNQEQHIIVDIIQKRPILRVINNDGVSYYIGEKNERIPLNNIFTVHVAVALGNIVTHADTKRDSTVQAALYHLIQFARKDKFLNAMIDQVYVNDNGDFDLIPKTGGHVIHFGNPEEDMAQKFERLKIFYKEGLTKIGWNKYKAIDLQFEGQVVCEKQDTTNPI